MKIFRKIKLPKLRGRKRKIFGTVALALSLFFGKPRLGSSHSRNSNFDTSTPQERVVNLYYDDDPQVTLVNAFNNNQVTPPANRKPGRNYLAPTPGGRANRPVYVPKHRTAPKTVNPGLGAGANPAGAGGGGGNAKFDDDKRPAPNKKQSKAAKAYDYKSHYQSQKKLSEDQCPVDEQNKAGVDELPDSSEYIYNLETKTAKKALRNVWDNPQAKKEVLKGLDRINKGELLPRNQKNFQGFKTLKEIKLTDTRMLVQPGKNGDPDKIVAIFMRRDLDDIVSKFKNKYK